MESSYLCLGPKQQRETSRCEKLGYLDWLVRDGKSVPKNPAGFLATAIRDDYKVPTGVTTKSPEARRPATKPRRLTRIETVSVPLAADSNPCPLRDHFDSLPPREAAAIESAAIETGNRFKVDTYRRLEEKRDGRWEALRWDLIRSGFVYKEFLRRDDPIYVELLRGMQGEALSKSFVSYCPGQRVNSTNTTIIPTTFPLIHIARRRNSGILSVYRLM